MIKILLDDKKKYFKANLHCHSTLSDGKKTPQELKKLYKEKGYSILAITDHEVIYDNSYLDDEDFITITSTEYSIKEFPEQSTLKNFNTKVCHLNLYAKDQHNTTPVCYNSVLDHYSDEKTHSYMKEKYGDYKRVYSSEGVNDIIKKAHENGYFVAYNHPRWSLENYSQYGNYEGLWGVEIFNTGVNAHGIYEYDINVFDDFLRDHKKIYATCGDDNHNCVDDMFGCFVMVNAEKLTYDSVINALLHGDFYSSTGPEIHKLWVEDNKVFIKCSDAKTITYSTYGRRGVAIHSEDGKTINEASFEIKENDGYFRIDVVDEKGNRANTQAYYEEDFLK